MKPVLILQHIDDGGPGLFARFLEKSGVPYSILRPDRGEPVPDADRLYAFSGISLCGGTQSANDPDTWILQEIDLLRAAAHRGMPVLGHCLGGQLLAKALGGDVHRHPVPEFGWLALFPAGTPVSDFWLNGLRAPLVAMQWHYDAFTLPPGAHTILTGQHCPIQAFARGPLLGMQFHIEATRETVLRWVTGLSRHLPAAGPSVQTAEEVLSSL
ncbi:MAG: type 1 glutamine amidotransferase, partial [Gammaproteobacteria bacterium]